MSKGTVADRRYAIEARKRKVPFGVIAKKCGVSKTTIRRWTVPEYQAAVNVYREAWKAKPENQARQREYDRRKPKGRCESCRGEMSQRKDGLCKSCRKEAQQFKRLDIQRYWNKENLTAGEIADRMNISRNQIESELTRMRREGWELTHRGGVPGSYLRRREP